MSILQVSVAALFYNASSIVRKNTEQFNLTFPLDNLLSVTKIICDVSIVFIVHLWDTGFTAPGVCCFFETLQDKSINVMSFH